MAEFINNINLGNNKDYQALYSSQLYGTFFMIYGRFTKDEKEEGSNTQIIKNLKLRILNYKGPIDLKIQHAKLEDLKDLNYDREDGALLTIEVGISGGVYKYDVTNLETLNSERKLDYYLYVERTVKKMRISEMNETGIFDNEYYYREGFSVEDEGDDISIEQDRFERKCLNPSKPPKYDEDKIGGKRCPNSKNLIFWPS